MMDGTRPSARQLTSWRKLTRRRHREKQGLFLAEGMRCVEQILTNKVIEVEALLTRENVEWRPPPITGYERYRLDSGDFESIVDTETTQGVAAVCRIPPQTTIGRLAERPGVIVATDSIQDPGNMGAICRSAVWFGAEGLLVGKGSSDLYHPKVVRSTAGATGALPYMSGELAPMLSGLEQAGWRVALLGSGPDAAIPLHRLEKGGRLVLVVGNEGSGIDDALSGDGRLRVEIESQSGRVESLNAAVALSVALYEATRP